MNSGNGFDNEGNLLPETFQPSEYDIICGRGKGCYMQPGNVKCREIVKEYLKHYDAARNKVEKSLLIQTIVSRIQAQDGGKTRFVCKATETESQNVQRWYEIPDDQAREKIGHCLREALLRQVGPKENKTRKQDFDRKQDDLLSLQRSIFLNLLVIQEQSVKRHLPVSLSLCREQREQQ